LRTGKSYSGQLHQEHSQDVTTREEESSVDIMDEDMAAGLSVRVDLMNTQHDDDKDMS